MRSDGQFCPIVISHSSKYGLRTWTWRDPKYQVDSSGVIVDTIVDQSCFEPTYYRGSCVSALVETKYLK